MNEILEELIKGSTILLEVEKLPEFWEFIHTQKDLYSFRYEYTDKLVKIRLDSVTQPHK